jgi:carbonic anhydrase
MVPVGIRYAISHIGMYCVVHTYAVDVPTKNLIHGQTNEYQLIHYHFLYSSLASIPTLTFRLHSIFHLVLF